ncbi:hypothetical protein D770_24820 [Flammeovirgaceae bacterium 311]|nr:hypothetical protein D770_24820 [Flammeovirgaceae bacterium 311]
MMYRFILDEDDYLSHQLFTASGSAIQKKTMIRTWLMGVLFFLIISLVSYLSDYTKLTNYILIMAAVFLVYFPLRYPSFVKRSYQKHLREHYKNKFGVASEIEFKEGFLICNSIGIESKIKLSEFEEVNETANHILVKVRSGESLIVPKAMDDIEQFKLELVSNLEGYHIPWHKKLDWKWN